MITSMLITLKCWRAVIFCIAATCICSFWPGGVSAYTVVKDVNSGRLFEEKVVIFDKAKGTTGIILGDPTSNSETSVDKDGAVEVRITGNKEINLTIHWKAEGDIPASFDVRQYNYLVLTCALLGDMKQSTPNGKVSAIRGDNLWYGVALLNDKDERVAGCSFADVAENSKTPAQMVTLKIPMVLFTQLASGDVSAVHGFGFPWNKAHDNQNRDFHLVIEKIALAD